LKAVLSVPTGYVGKDSVIEEDRTLRPIDSWQKLREMLSAGWDIVPHGRFHFLRGPYVFMPDNILRNEIIHPIIDFKRNMGNEPRVFVPPGLTTHQNPLGKRELKLLTRFYDTILLNSGYNYPSPILNQIYRSTLWSIPATDNNEWIQMLMRFLKRLKLSGNYGMIIIFFHEIYVAKNEKKQYGFSYERLKVLLNNLCKLGINICSLSEAIAEIRKHQRI
jgi:peptidoglycan/xylan/chitin deacetylase (PgdA/CDA1 family)